MLACGISNDRLIHRNRFAACLRAYPERIASTNREQCGNFNWQTDAMPWLGIKTYHAHELAGCCPWICEMGLENFLASQLNPRDLLPMVKEREIITWDSQGRACCQRIWIGNIILIEAPCKTWMTKNSGAISAAICQGRRVAASILVRGHAAIFNFASGIDGVLASWPDVEIPAGLARNEHWFKPYLQARKTNPKNGHFFGTLHSLSWSNNSFWKTGTRKIGEVRAINNSTRSILRNGAMPVLRLGFEF